MIYQHDGGREEFLFHTTAQEPKLLISYDATMFNIGRLIMLATETVSGRLCVGDFYG